MPGKFHHERLYRGDALVGRLAALRLTICGAGALGSHLADNLARQGAASLRVIDHDRVEEHNVSTQLYGESDIGAWKVDALRNHLFRAVGVEIEALRKELTAQNARALLKNSELVIDMFDNSASRALVQQHSCAAAIPCLHVGLYEEYAEVVWDEGYRVPRDVAGDICDYPLARNLVLLAVATASEAIFNFIASGERADRSITLRDLAIRRVEEQIAVHRP